MAEFIVKDVRVFTGDKVIDSGYVHVSNGQIKAVGDVASLNAPSTAKVISQPGKTLIPGFIDAHIHADKGRTVALSQSLAFGVTTVMDMHNEPVNVAKLKKLAAEDKNVADFKAAGISATIRDGWPAPVVTLHDKSPEVLKRTPLY